VYALALISLLAWWPDRIWGAQHHLLYLAATTAVTAVSVVVAVRVQALQQAESSAPGHRRAFAAIVEHSEDAIIAVDLDGTITGWNTGAQHLYGYSAAEMIGASSLAFHTRVRPADADVLLGPHNRGSAYVVGAPTLTQAKDAIEVEQFLARRRTSAHQRPWSLRSDGFAAVRAMWNMRVQIDVA
jgi:PAS domain S-box-containing protein